jgi:HAD superfamily hydrolase (TIGR01509 family)
VIEALLLDFDGLLYDTESASYEAWNEVFARYGERLALEVWVREAIGRPPGQSGFDPADQLEESVGRPLDRVGIAEARETSKQSLLPDRLIAGADELLQGARIRGLRTAIVTSNFTENVVGHLARAGCTFAFDAIITADGDPGRGKPSPTLYLEALAELQLTADQAVAFEDSPTGIAAAKAAGLFCIAVPNDITRGAPGVQAADRVLASLKEVDLDALVP